VETKSTVLKNAVVHIEVIEKHRLVLIVTMHDAAEWCQTINHVDVRGAVADRKTVIVATSNVEMIVNWMKHEGV